MKDINSKSLKIIESQCLEGKNGNELLTMTIQKDNKFFEGDRLLHIETGKWKLAFDFIDIKSPLEDEHEAFYKVCIFDTFDECLKVYNREIEYYQNQGKVSDWVEKETCYVDFFSTI